MDKAQLVAKIEKCGTDIEGIFAKIDAEKRALSADEQAQITKLEGEQAQAKNPPPGSYWKSEAKQVRYRELLQMRDRQKARG